MKTSLFLTTAIAGLLFTGVAAAADPITFVIQKDAEGGELTGDNELPDKVNSANSGTAKLTFYPDKKQLCGTVEFQPAGFKYTAVHIHEGDDKTPSGEAYINLAADPGEGTIHVNVKDLIDSQITKLTTGENYVNVHSTDHTGGEMRGQLVKDETATPEVCEEEDAGTGTGTGTSSSSGSTTSSSGSSGTDAGTAATPASTDDGGGCNTSGSNGGNALALLAGLGVVVAAASRKRKKA